METNWTTCCRGGIIDDMISGFVSCKRRIGRRFCLICPRYAGGFGETSPRYAGG